MATAIQAILLVFLQVAQATGTSGATAETIQAIINALVKLIPIIVDLAPALVSSAKSVVAALEANDAAVPDQVALLKAQLPTEDADFEDAVRTAEANDAAADASGS